MQNNMWTIATSYVRGTTLPQAFDFAFPVRMAPKRR